MTQFAHALHSLEQHIAQARADGRTLRVCGGGSKDFYTRQTLGALLDTRGLSGVVSYEPSELVVTAGAGTPLAVLEALLEQQGQYLPFEPPHFSYSGGTGATVGGMVASGLAGPARASVGGVRDFVLGLKLLNGLGQHLTFGGQVMKNVAGYDVSRLMAGALGTLGVITEISLKVLPRPPAEVTLQFALDQGPALEQLHRWGGQPLPLNASCWVHDTTTEPSCQRLFVRLRGAVAAVEAASSRMLADVPGVRLDNAVAQPDWAHCRNHTLPFFQQPPNADACLWRLSVPQTAPVMPLPGATLVEWHGALRWIWARLDAAPALREAAHAVGGAADLFWAPATTVGPARRMAAADPALAAIYRRLKSSFDPHHLFNPDLSPDAN